MRIRKLEIQGFKSFPDRTTFHFGAGISGIVGSNGCGKSNVVDAVKWCLGEQSARSLRGKAMGDIIFAGSQERSPMSLAEVTLSFIADDEPFPGEFARCEEVQVTRRLFRDGQSEYLLNQQRVRLRDVQDLFLDTGVSNRMYSFIEQGRIGEIVNARPEQRRALFEEAAGISRYKLRRDEAQQKLEETLQNLERATTVVDDLDKRLRALVRQVERATRYRRLRSRLQQAEVFLGLSRYSALIGDRKALSDDLRVAAEEEARLRRSLERREEELAQRRAALEVLDAGVGRLRDELAELEATRREQESARQYQSRELANLQGRLLTLEQQHKQAAEEREAAAEERALAAEDRGRVETRLAGIEQALARSRQELTELEQDIQRRSKMIERAKADQLRLVSRIATHRAALESATVRRRDLEQRMQRVQDASEEVGEQAEELAMQLAAAEEALAEAREEHASRGRRLEAARGVLARAQQQQQASRAAVRQAEEALGKAEREEAKVKTRLESLIQLQSAHEGVEDDLRKALHLPGVRGTLAEHLDVPEALEAPLTAAVGAALDAVLADTDDAALAAAAAVKGRAIVLSLEGRPAPDARGFLARVGGTDVGRAALAVLLAGSEESPDLPAALAAWRASGRPQVILSSRHASVSAAGAITVGEPRAAGTAILARRRQIAALEVEIQQYSARTAQARQALEGGQEAAAAAAAGIEAAQEAEALARRQVSESDLAARQAQQRREEVEREQRRQALSAERLGGELLEVERALEEHAEQVRQRQEAIQQDLEEQAEVEENLNLNQAALAEENTRARAAREGLGQFTTETAGLRERLAGLRRSETAAAAAEDRAARQLESHHQEITRSKARIIELLEDDKRLAASLQALGEQQAALRIKLEEARERVQRERGDLQQLEDALRSNRERLETARTAKSKLEGRLAEIKAEVGRIRDALQSQHEIAVSALLDRLERDGHVTLPVDPAARRDAVPGAPAPGPQDQEYLQDLRITADLLEDGAAAALWTQRAEADRAALAKLGEVNLIAVEEYAEVEARYQELKAQREDLEESVRVIRQMIATLNRTCRERFRETFDQVDACFREIYPRLVGGGQARLALTDEEDLLETGVEIYAQPPGKRLQSLSLLSGGEMAMVAIALIFSLFRIKPSPFCLLDEVDAPLDEGNGARFNRMLQEMARSSQFIVITHNKKTMECADTLYGVTMVQPGVSALVSVKLD